MGWYIGNGSPSLPGPGQLLPSGLPPGRAGDSPWPIPYIPSVCEIAQMVSVFSGGVPPSPPLVHSLYTELFPISHSPRCGGPGGSGRGSQAACRGRSHGPVHHYGPEIDVLSPIIWERSYHGLSFLGG